MLLGADITIHTDHRNLTFHNFNTQRVIRWRLYVEECSPKIVYVPGPENVIADALSRLPIDDDDNEDVDDPVESNTEGKNTDMNSSFVTDHSFSLFESDRLFHSFLNLPSPPTQENPLDLTWIKHLQEDDEALGHLQQGLPNSYIIKDFGDDNDDLSLVCYARNEDPEDWKICLPENAVLPTIRWFHQVLNHPGQQRLFAAISARYYHPQLRSHVNHFVCDSCQLYKIDGPGYGHLAPRETWVAPWTEVAVDLIGPWVITIGNETYTFKALTCIDTTMNLTELIRIDEATSSHVRDKFDQAWLSRYPLPSRCVHDNGPEFTGQEFEARLHHLNIKNVTTTSYNPQANAICERMHQSVGNVLRTLLYANPPTNLNEARDLIDSALATASHAMRANIHLGLRDSPGALAFGRDMFLPVPLIADWIAIREHRERLIDHNLMRQNKKRRAFDYVQGQQVLKYIHKPTKLGRRVEGPYTIQQVHTNGTLTIELRPSVHQRINIRRVKPYRVPS